MRRNDIIGSGRVTCPFRCILLEAWKCFAVEFLGETQSNLELKAVTAWHNGNRDIKDSLLIPINLIYIVEFIFIQSVDCVDAVN